jgi:hypothetical protein
MALIGMRDIRDYLVQVRPDEQSTGLASPFNVKKKSLTLANFTRDEIQSLYSQHTEATGQAFSQEAIERAWSWSDGQPWLVNALAYEVVIEQLKKDYTKVIAGSNIDQAAHSLILRNETHFDSLRERLKEPRVRRVMEAIVIGASVFPRGISTEDVSYAVDLGLLKTDPSNSMSYLPANPIYQEIIVRTMTSDIQMIINNDIPITYKNKWMDGINLDMSGLIKAFQTYWSENSEMYKKNNMIDSLITNSINSALEKYSLSNKTNIAEDIINAIKDDLVNLTNEALTHLVLFAFFQRVLNGDVDFLQIEYALGSQRSDICVSYKGHRYPVELKMKSSIEGPKKFEESLDQLRGYMDKSRAKEGWLVIFDRDLEKSWDKKLTWETQEYKGKTIHVVGC